MKYNYTFPFGDIQTRHKFCIRFYSKSPYTLKFEVLNLQYYSMDFQVKGLIWKHIHRTLKCQYFIKLSNTIIEKSVGKEAELTGFLCTKRRIVVNKSAVKSASLSTGFSVTVRLNFTKYWDFKVRWLCFQMSPLTWKSIEEHGRLRTLNLSV